MMLFRDMSSRGLVLLTVLLLCSNILLVSGQRGRLSTSVRGPRWIPRSSTTSSSNSISPTTTTTTTTSTTATTAETSNITSAISAQGEGDKNDKATDNEKDVLPTNITLTKVDEGKVEEKDEKTTKEAPATTTTPEEPKVAKDLETAATEALNEEVVLVKATSTEKKIARAENLKEAKNEVVSPVDSEKVTAKRDLPFVIQSRPGMSNPMLLKREPSAHCKCHLEWITV